MYHRCFAPRTHYLDTADYEVKTMRKVRQRVEIAAAGGFLKGSGSKRVVKWDSDGHNVRPGPSRDQALLKLLLHFNCCNNSDC
jgi:hypothetical protein